MSEHVVKKTTIIEKRLATAFRHFAWYSVQAYVFKLVNYMYIYFLVEKSTNIISLHFAPIDRAVTDPPPPKFEQLCFLHIARRFDVRSSNDAGFGQWVCLTESRQVVFAIWYMYKRPVSK